MKIMAIGAEKGGVGKSTTTLYLAARAAERLGSNAAHPTVAIVDRDRDQHLSGLWRRRSDVRRDSIILMPDTALPHPESGIELVLIDTPPGAQALATLAEAQMVVVPCPPTEMAVESLATYLGRVRTIIRRTTPHMRLVAVLPTIVKKSRLHQAHLFNIADIAAAHTPPLLLLPAIPDRTSVQVPDLSSHEYDAAAEELFDNGAL